MLKKESTLFYLLSHRGDSVVNISALLLADRNVRTDLIRAVKVNLSIDNRSIMFSGGKNLSPGGNHRRVAPGLVLGVRVASRRSSSNVELVINSTTALKEFPMSRSSSSVKGTRVHEKLAALLAKKHGILREADVVADTNTNLAVRGVEDGDRVTGAQSIGLLESDAARNIDVEEVDLAVLGKELTLRADNEAGVVYLAFRVLLGEGSAHKVDTGLLSHLDQHRGGGVNLGIKILGRRRDFLGVFGEHIGGIGAVEALREGHKLGAVAGSLLDGLASGREVGGLVSAHEHLAHGKLEHLLAGLSSHRHVECKKSETLTKDEERSQWSSSVSYCNSDLLLASDGLIKNRRAYIYILPTSLFPKKMQ